MRKAIEKLDIESLHEYRKHLLSSIKVEVVCHGNMCPDELINLGKSISQKLKSNEPFVAYPQRKVVRISEGSNFHYSFKCNSNGNAMILFLQMTDCSVKTEYLCKLLLNILKPKFFAQLRTQEQLGYVVDCFISDAGGLGLAFVIDSSEYSADYLLEKTEAFLKQMEQEVNSISEAAFAANKKALNNTLAQMHQPTNPSEYRALFLHRFQSNQYQFNRIFDKVLEEITLTSLQELYSTMIHPNTRRQVVVKSKDEIWGASNLKEILTNLKDSSETADSIEKVTDLIFSYAKTSHQPYCIIEDIHALKKEAEWFPDEMAEGERNILSLLEFNDDLPKESFANGKLVDEDQAKEALETTSLIKNPVVVETILAYSFSHYKMKECTKSKLDSPIVVSSNLEMSLKPSTLHALKLQKHI